MNAIEVDNQSFERKKQLPQTIFSFIWNKNNINAREVYKHDSGRKKQENLWRRTWQFCFYTLLHIVSSTISKQMAGWVLLLAWQTPLLDDFNAVQSFMRHMVTSISYKEQKIWKWLTTSLLTFSISFGSCTPNFSA